GVGEEFIEREVKFVGPCGRAGVEDAARRSAVFRGERVGFDFELLNGIRIEIHDRLILRGDGVGCAVEKEFVRRGALSVNRIRDGGDLIDGEIVDADRRADTGYQQRQGVGIAAEERQLADLLVSDYL